MLEIRKVFVIFYATMTLPDKNFINKKISELSQVKNSSLQSCVLAAEIIDGIIEPLLRDGLQKSANKTRAWHFKKTFIFDLSPQNRKIFWHSSTRLSRKILVLFMLGFYNKATRLLNAN